MKILLFFVLLIPNYSYAKAAEKWICKDAYGTWENILAVAYVNKDRKTGAIKVAGVKHKSRYLVKGFERRWDFSLRDDYTYEYAFIIKPNGDASYYDFSNAKSGETVKSSMFFTCKTP